MSDAVPVTGRTSAERVGGRFANPPGQHQPGCGPGGLARFLWGRVTDRRVPVPPPGHCLGPAAVASGRRACAGRDHLTWLGHAAFLLELGGRTLLTDPFLSDVAAPRPLSAPRRFVPPALTVAELPPIDLLLISHAHYDHLDAPTIRALRQRSDPDVLVPLGLDGFFRRRGYERVQALDWWQTVTCRGLRITAVPAVHFSRRGPFDRNTSLWCGYVVETLAGRRLYFVGDTAYAPLFREIGAAFAPIDTVLVPIGAYEPRGVMRQVHVNPEEAAALCRDVGAQSAVAMHWGTIVLTDEPPFEPPARWRKAMADQGFAGEAARVPAIGATLRL